MTIWKYGNFAAVIQITKQKQKSVHARRGKFKNVTINDDIITSTMTGSTNNLKIKR